MSTIPMPPRWLRTIVRGTLPIDDQQSMIEDLDGLYRVRHGAQGRGSANRWYLRQALAFVFRLGTGRAADAASVDIVHAMRTFRRRPAFTAAFLITLAVGTGVLATVYAAARWVMLRPVAGVGAPQDLVTLRLGSSQAPSFVSFDVSQADLVELRKRLPVGGALAGVTDIEVDVRREHGDAQRVSGEMVTANYLSVLRTQLAAGTSFNTIDDDPRAGVTSVILSDHLARALNSVDPRALVGESVRINGVLVTISGVARPGFHGAELPARSDFWLPLSALPIIDPSVDMDRITSRGNIVWRRMLARPLPGVTSASLQAAANRVMEEIRAEFGGEHSFLATHFQMQAFAGVGLDPGVRQSVTRTLKLLAAAAALLLALAIANLTNLALVQATLHEGTTAIRVALGATQARITRAILMETMLLGVGGGVIALVLATVWSQWFRQTRLDERGAPLEGMHLDTTVIALSMAAALVAALVACIGPVRILRSGAIERLLRRDAVGSSSTHRTRSILVSVQVGLTVVLLVASALLARTVGNLRSIDLGFSPDRLLTFSLDPHLHGYESAALGQLARNIAQRVAELPGVTSAAFVSPTPLGSGYLTASLYATSDPEAKPVVGAGFFVSPGFIETIGLTVVAGDRNWRADSGTVVISRGALGKLYPGMSPDAAIGLLLPTRRGGKNAARVAAVIEDVKFSDITADPPPVILRPLSQRPKGISMSGMVRSTGNPLNVAAAVHNVTRAAAPELPLFNMRSARDAIDLQFAERHAMARTATTLGTIGLLLAAIGLYGVLANVVAARRREFGIRSALGASPGRILLMVAMTGLVPVAAGAVFGLGASLWTTRWLSSQLYALERLDPLSYFAAISAMLVAAFLACLVPAVRAVHFSPAEVLREE